MPRLRSETMPKLTLTVKRDLTHEEEMEMARHFAKFKGEFASVGDSLDFKKQLRKLLPNNLKDKAAGAQTTYGELLGNTAKSMAFGKMDGQRRVYLLDVPIFPFPKVFTDKVFNAMCKKAKQKFEFVEVAEWK